MNSLFTRFATLTLLLLVGPATQLIAQQKPVGIIAVASVDEILSDIEHVGELTGVAQLMNARFMAGLYTEGIDTSKPSGAVVTMKGELPVVTVFVPIKNYDTILTRLEDQFGEGDDAGNGITKFTLQQEIFVKEQAGYAIASNDEESLGLVPKDPSKLTKSTKDYDISARILIKNIPDEFKEQAVEQLKAGFELGAQDLDEDIAENGLDQITRLINESEEFSFGLSIDPEKSKSKIDFKFTALPGTKLAKQMDMLYESSTNFAGFLNDAAALRFNFSTKVDPEDNEQLVTMMKSLREQAHEEIDNNDELGDDATKAAVKEAIDSLLEVAEDTAKTGVTDAGGFVSLEDGDLSAVAGGFVADGTKVEDALKKLARALKDETAPLKIKFNAGAHGGISLHTLTVPVPDEEDAQKILGDELDVAIGTGAKSVYVALGDGAVNKLKKVIDQSKAESGRPTKPFFLQAKIGDIIKFAASVEEDEEALQAVAAKVAEFAGTDRVTLQIEPAKRGVSYGLEIEDGVLKIIGAMTPEDDGF